MFYELPLNIIYPFLIIFGLIVGSFLNVCIYRIPRERSVATPRSFCPKCRSPIRWYYNIPVLSYILLRGRCRDCKRSISLRYPIVEILSALFSLFVYLKFQAWLPYVFYYLLLTAPLIVIAFIDLEHRIIPDVITVPGIVIGVISQFVLMHGSLIQIGLNAFLGIIVGGGFLFVVGLVYEKLKNQEGLGGGDVKLAAMLGAFFGWKGVIFILFLSSVVGSLFGIIIVFLLKKGLKYAIPFGPFLVIGALIYLFWGEVILSWYLGMI